MNGLGLFFRISCAFLAAACEGTRTSSGEEISAPSSELAQKVIDRINAAAEMGDVMQIKTIAAELKSESDAMEPFCSKLVQLAENFDFDGIQKLCLR